MRLALACLLSLPATAFADSFTVSSTPTAVTIYGSSAQVTRAVTVDLPGGTHDVVLPDLPAWIEARNLRVSVTGATLGATQFRNRALPPQPDQDSAAIIAAKERIEAAERAITALEDEIATALLSAKAAQAKADFLRALGQNEGLPSDVDSLRTLAQMIAAETRAAEKMVLTAEQEARDIEDRRADLEKELEDARDALTALTPPLEEKSQLTVTLSGEAPGQATLSISYPAFAAWRPTYDVFLTGEDPATLEVRRGAVISQETDENWENVAVTLSSLQPTEQVAPSQVFPYPRRIGEPEPPQAELRMTDAEPRLEAPVIIESMAEAQFDGPGVTYTVAEPLSLASGVDAARIMLDTLSFDARRFARAAPARDQTAFLMAAFTNTTQEPLLQSEEAAFYIDNTLVGRGFFDAIPAGGENELAFGPIEDLRLSHTVLDQAEGDRGFINRSNAQSEKVRMEVENLGQKDWDVEVRGVVPYAVQEDLVIDWSATPAPTLENVDDARGVLQWDLNVPAGSTASIDLRHTLSWPEGMELR